MSGKTSMFALWFSYRVHCDERQDNQKYTWATLTGVLKCESDVCMVLKLNAFETFGKFRVV